MRKSNGIMVLFFLVLVFLSPAFAVGEMVYYIPPPPPPPPVVFVQPLAVVYSMPAFVYVVPPPPPPPPVFYIVASPPPPLPKSESVLPGPARAEKKILHRAEEKISLKHSGTITHRHIFGQPALAKQFSESSFSLPVLPREYFWIVMALIGVWAIGLIVRQFRRRASG